MIGFGFLFSAMREFTTVFRSRAISHYKGVLNQRIGGGDSRPEVLPGFLHDHSFAHSLGADFNHDFLVCPPWLSFNGSAQPKLMKRKSFYSHLYFWVLAGMVLGIFVGNFFPQVGIKLKPLGDGFIRLIRMVIAPIIFTTVVVGVAALEHAPSVSAAARAGMATAAKVTRERRVVVCTGVEPLG